MTEITIQEFKAYRKVPTGLRFIIEKLNERGCIADLEYKFSPDRKYRSDVHFSVKIIMGGENHYLVEYEGLPLQVKKSGHTTVTGYTNNCEKYNLATLMGFKVLRYTALNYKQFEKDLEKICNLVKK